jgi:2-oxoglutarate ferredoxin oxidoreductase subunit beta
MSTQHPALDLLRENRLPHLFCEGCGIGTILNALVRALLESGIDLEKTVLVSGIGCSSRIPGYLNLDSLHTTHGRPLAFATGIKIGNPELTVLVITGDGDLAAIGGNHFLHACRRNVDLVTLCVNNFNYGMTGGQHGPTTPLGGRTTTTRQGNVEPPLDIARVAVAAGANYVARWTTLHPEPIKESLLEALGREGFSLIEVIAQCPTGYGKRNRMETGPEMMEDIKDRIIPLRRAVGGEGDEEDLAGKISIGVFADRRRRGLVRALGLLPETEGGREEESGRPPEIHGPREEVRMETEAIDRLIEQFTSPRLRFLLEEEEDLRRAEEEIARRVKSAQRD